MLHVLLIILKIIGIVLLSLLLILILILLAILFVPLQYRIYVKRIGEVFRADLSVSWFLKLLRLEGAYQDKEAVGELKIMNHTLKRFRYPEKTEDDGAKLPEGQEKLTGHEEENKPEKEAIAETTGAEKAAEGGEAEKSGDAEKTSGEETEKSGDAEKTAETEKTEKPDKSTGAEKTAESEIKGEAEESEKTAGAEEAGQADDAADTKKAAASEKPDKNKAGGEESDAGKFRSALQGLRDKLVAFLESLPSYMLRILEALTDILLKILNLPTDVYNSTDDAVARLLKKENDIHRKLKPLFSIEAEHVLSKLPGYIRYLLDGWKPRRIEGWMKYGTGAPDLTGKVTGLIYLILPVSADKFSAEPDFYETVFQADMVIYGHIRLYRLAYVAVKLLLDKEFRILLRKVLRKKK